MILWETWQQLPRQDQVCIITIVAYVLLVGPVIFWPSRLLDRRTRVCDKNMERYERNLVRRTKR